jgi:hypothetical protein
VFDYAKSKYTPIYIVSLVKITIEGRAIYGNLENKINTLYWPVENSICQVTAALLIYYCIT